MLRVPVLSPEGKPLMPTKLSRARRWIKEKKAVGFFNKLGQFYVQLLVEPSDSKTQPISCGIDPGRLFSGIGVQSDKFTLFTTHLELPFKKVRERMDNRRMMRRARRGRRINRKLPFHLRAHRQKRFNNRKQGKLPPYNIRKGDFVKAEKAGKVFSGWCSGDTAKQISVSDFNWKRLGQFTASKVVLLQRSTGLICKQETDFVGVTIC